MCTYDDSECIKLKPLKPSQFIYIRLTLRVKWFWESKLALQINNAQVKYQINIIKHQLSYFIYICLKLFLL